MDNQEGIICEVGSSDYNYVEGDNDYNISIQNYCFENKNGFPGIISNYFISKENLKNADEDYFCLFATIVWDEIKYTNEDYNPYNYDPDPLMVFYRDDLSKEKTEKILNIIDKLCETYYEPTSNYKHFNPQLPKIKLSEITDQKYSTIVDEFKKLMEHYENI